MTAPVPARDAGRKGGLTARRWWPWAVNAAKLAFFVLVAWLLVTQARTIAWREVWETVVSRPPRSLLLAALLATASYALYGSFDLLGRHLTGHALPRRQVIEINLVCYAFNMNLGATVGGAGFRYRLYSRLGLDAATITHVVAATMLTNWIGYLLLGGLLFLLRPPALPPEWRIGAMGLQAFGAALLALALAYLLLCAFAGGRRWHVRGYEATTPTLRFALLQLALSCTNWLLMAGMLYVLMAYRIAFTDVLGVLLLSAVAGLITHVPGGLGVLEAVFVALLSDQMAKHDLLASVLLYRTFYYFVPLALAGCGYLAMEAHARHAASPH